MAGPSVTNTFSNSTTADATQVNQNFTDLINGATDGTKDYSINALTCAGTATLNGNVNLGNASSDDLTITASLASSLAIKTTNSYDIGSATLGLRSLYIASGDSAAKSVRLLAGTIGTSYTLTLPTGVPAANNSVMEFTTGGVGSFRALKVPTVSIAMTGSHSGGFSANGTGTYTTPSGVKWIRVRMVGGGGGGGCSGNGAGSGTAGVATTFGTTLLSATGGTAGGNGGAGGAGGGNSAASSVGAASGLAFAGASGTAGGQSGTAGVAFPGGKGAGTAFGDGGAGGAPGGSAGGSGVAGTGAGGGGGSGGSSTNSGGGGGAGGFVDAVITGPDATYSYTVGTGGAGGSASGNSGGAGVDGIIIVEEFYQ